MEVPSKDLETLKKSLEKVQDCDTNCMSKNHFWFLVDLGEIKLL